jgi:hypothetical protein
MEKYAIIYNGQVVNTIEYESAPSNPPPGFADGHIAIPLPIGVYPKWSYNNEVWTEPQPYPSWTLVNNVWTPPIPEPSVTSAVWNELLQRWDIVLP